MANSSRLWLVAVETAHIQSYIFNSNRLKENIGASYLVAAATDAWAREVVNRITNPNVSFEEDNAPHIEDVPTLEAEIIYAGGGNFVCLFRTQELARSFLRELSRKVLFEAPGLHIIGHMIEYVWPTGSQGEALSTAIQIRLLPGLKEQRNHQPLTRGLLGLSVTAMCDSTSQPAVTLMQNQDGEHFVYSAESAAKQVYASQANDELRRDLHLEDHFRYPLDFDDLGRTKGEKSYLAVVHADGNGMGLLVQDIGKRFSSPDKNRDYIQAMRRFSRNIKTATQNAVQATMSVLQHQAFDENGVIRDTLSNQALLSLIYDDRERQWILPFRPLISGGDDVTFVCDGRIGLSLAALYLEYFERATREIFAKDENQALQKGLTACAGIAIVKSHYPFARAYELAEDLCQSAKKLVQKTAYSGLDWHFTAGGLYSDLETMRDREYANGLTLRPVFLDIKAHDYQSWGMIERLVTEFQQKWSENRSKAKELMEVLREGPDATKAYQTRSLKPQGIALPMMPVFDANGGWYNGHCGYYDALELLDLFVPLNTSSIEAAHG